jgi:hypothetical protein
MKLFRWPLLILLPLVPVALAFAYRFLAIDACLDMGGSASSTFRSCVIVERGYFLSSYKLVNPTLTTLMFLGGLGAIVYWVTLFKRSERVVRGMLGFQIAAIIVVGASVFLGHVQHTSWQPLLIYAGWLAGVLACIASVLAQQRFGSWKWLWTIPAVLVLGVVGLYLTVACCLRMGS